MVALWREVHTEYSLTPFSGGSRKGDSAVQNVFDCARARERGRATHARKKGNQGGSATAIQNATLVHTHTVMTTNGCDTYRRQLWFGGEISHREATIT